MKVFGLPVFVSLIAVSCAEQREPINLGSTIFGYYSFEDSLVIGYTGIELNADSTYVYGSGMCVGSSIDSGSFTMNGDTLFLKSVLENKVDTSNHGFDQIRPLTGEKYLLKGNQIFYWLENGKYDTSAVWSKQESI